jgi:putative transposase
MPRYIRIVVPEFPHHLVHKGNCAQAVFLDKADYERYLALLQTYSEKFKCGIQAYCLMPNHVHMLAVPADVKSLAETMQAAAYVYSRYFNRKYKREGHVWGNRFYSSVVDSDEYHWTAALYIEQNPVRAGIVPSAEMYAYSSARAHAGDAKDALLTSSLFDEFERKEYIKALREPLGEEDLSAARQNLRSRKPLGSSGFIEKMERILNVSLHPKPCAPKKNRKTASRPHS